MSATYSTWYRGCHACTCVFKQQTWYSLNSAPVSMCQLRTTQSGEEAVKTYVSVQSKATCREQTMHVTVHARQARPSNICRFASIWPRYILTSTQPYKTAVTWESLAYNYHTSAHKQVISRFNATFCLLQALYASIISQTKPLIRCFSSPIFRSH